MKRVHKTGKKEAEKLKETEKVGSAGFSFAGYAGGFVVARVIWQW